MVNSIVISDDAMSYLKTDQRDHKKKTWKHKEYAEIVDELIGKAKQFDAIKDTRIHTHTRRNLKPPIMKV